MNIFYLGSFFEKSREEEIWQDSKHTMVVAGDTFQKALINGFTRNNNITLFTIPAIGSYPLRYKKLWFRRSMFQYNARECICGGFLNLTFLKRYSICYSIKKNLRKWIETTTGNKTIIVYALLNPYLKAAVDLKKEYPDIKICCIVLDLPQFFDDETGFARTIMSRIYQRECDRLQQSIDSFVLLTEQMASILSIKSKPYMIMEGIYSAEDSVSPNVEKAKEKIILYTGKLDKRFGITELLDAFIAIPDTDYRLWICGDGLARDIVESYTKKDSRILYYGMVKRELVLKLQKQATILINPRRADEEYTKYSFPSKTMEYMASGTPTMMYPLPGMPSEYLEFVVAIKRDSTEDLKNRIIEWCEKPKDELVEFGQRAKQFILENKNSRIQAQRLIEFVGQNQ